MYLSEVKLTKRYLTAYSWIVPIGLLVVGFINTIQIGKVTHIELIRGITEDKEWVQSADLKSGAEVVLNII